MCLLKGAVEQINSLFSPVVAYLYVSQNQPAVGRQPVVLEVSLAGQDFC